MFALIYFNFYKISISFLDTQDRIQNNDIPSTEVQQQRPATEIIRESDDLIYDANNYLDALGASSSSTSAETSSSSSVLLLSLRKHNYYYYFILVTSVVAKYL